MGPIDDELVIRKKNLTVLGGRGSRLTLASRFAIGVRKGLSNIGSADFGRTLMIDLSRQVVNRCEVQTAAALVAACQTFHSDAMQHIVVDPSEAGSNHTLLAVAVKADATNSNIFRMSKLHVMELHTAFIKDHDAMRRAQFRSAIKEWRCVSDLMPLGDLTGAGSYMMILKQLGSLGAPTWESRESGARGM